MFLQASLIFCTLASLTTGLFVLLNSLTESLTAPSPATWSVVTYHFLQAFTFGLGAISLFLIIDNLYLFFAPPPQMDLEAQKSCEKELKQLSYQFHTILSILIFGVGCALSVLGVFESLKALSFGVEAGLPCGLQGFAAVCELVKVERDGCAIVLVCVLSLGVGVFGYLLVQWLRDQVEVEEDEAMDEIDKIDEKSGSTVEYYEEIQHDDEKPPAYEDVVAKEGV